jgi:hypothetical protein
MNSLRKYLPSKKFAVITGSSLVVIIVGYFVFLYAKTYSALNNPIITTASVSTAEEILSRDTDGDGIQDWEESLWGTDPQKTSTFNNEPDKTYVERKRAEISKNSGETNSNPENLNDTEKIAREFLTTILALKESGTLNAFNIDNLTQKFSADIGKDVTLPNHYLLTDIKASSDSKESKAAYYTKIKAASLAAQKGGMGSEFPAVIDFFSNEDASTKNFQTLTKTYATLVKNLESMQVPPSARLSHLMFLNESYNMNLIFKNMSNINDDSVIGLVAVAQFKAHESKLEASIQSLADYFKANAIIK